MDPTLDAQKLAMVQQQARVSLFSTLDSADVQRAYMTSIDDLAATINAATAEGPVAILPEGPMTIPYLV